jgi:hypothetical protein
MISNNNNKCHSIPILETPNKTLKTNTSSNNIMTNGTTCILKELTSTRVIEEMFHMMNMNIPGMKKITHSNQISTEEAQFHHRNTKIKKILKLIFPNTTMMEPSKSM